MPGFGSEPILRLALTPAEVVFLLVAVVAALVLALLLVRWSRG